MKVVPIILVLAVLIVGCVKPDTGISPHATPSPMSTPVPQTPEADDTKHVLKPYIAFFEHNETWKVLVTFTLPNPCHKMGFIGIERIDNTFILNFNHTPPDPEKVCIQVLKKYEKTIELGKLESGTYKIIIFVNGIKVEQKEFVVH